jgi:ATP-binding protein involved in chromosome partitioning
VISEQAVREALVGVIDPEIRRSVVELDMVRSVTVADPLVEVTIALTVPGCPMKADLEGQVRERVGGVEGVGEVRVSFDVMTPEQRASLRDRLQGGGQGEQKPIALRPTTHVVALASGKGGVGKSTLAVNLAAALAAGGAEVGVVDADIYGYSIPRMLGIDRRPVVVDGMIVPPVVHDLRVISIGFFTQPDAAVVWRGPMLHRALEQFLTDVHWGDLDYLIVDMPPGTGDVSISLGQLLPEPDLVLVTTPQPAAQSVARRAAEMAGKTGMRVAGVVENMSYLVCPCCGERSHPFGSGGGGALADELNVPLLGQIPLDEPLRVAADDGRPLVLTDPDAASARAIGELAAELPGVLRPRRPAERISQRLGVVS